MRTAALLATAAILATVTTAPPADAKVRDRRECVTLQEFNQWKVDWHRPRVEAMFDTAGVRHSQRDGRTVKVYPTCPDEPRESGRVVMVYDGLGVVRGDFWAYDSGAFVRVASR